MPNASMAAKPNAINGLFMVSSSLTQWPCRSHTLLPGAVRGLQFENNPS
jgi:hypothetical protein